MRVQTKLFSVAFLVAATAVSALAGPTKATPARTLMEEASAKARAEKKNVLVIFHATWCGWCKKMDSMLESAEFKKTFENSYVITHVDVEEHDKTKMDLMNEGGEQLMNELGGKGAGLPFWAILSPEGTKLADSMLPKTGNIGFPSEPNEVAGFREILKKTAPKMRPVDIDRIEKFLSTKPAATGAGH